MGRFGRSGEPLPLAPAHNSSDHDCPNYPNGCLVCCPGQGLLAQPKTTPRK